ncbi:MAG: hypothetical protein L0Z55_06750 [Planctomycetes bacterium]|nr:hypothetical protein [Planctomycetota bacterium]
MTQGILVGLLTGVILAAMPIAMVGGGSAPPSKTKYMENFGGEIPNGYGALKGVAGTKEQLILVFEDASNKGIYIMELNGSTFSTQVRKLTRSTQ